MSAAMKNLLKAIKTDAKKDGVVRKKERKEVKATINELIAELEHFRRRKMSELPASAQKNIMAALEEADKQLSGVCARKIFEAQLRGDGRRTDLFCEPLEDNQVWVFIRRLHRQSAIISEEGVIIPPPPKRPRHSDGFNETIGDVAIITPKKAKKTPAKSVTTKTTK